MKNETYSYDDLDKGWTIVHLKRDVLLEAVRDVWLLDHIKCEFEEELNVAPDKVTQYTVRFILELIKSKFVRVARWDKEDQEIELDLSPAELEDLIENLDHPSFSLQTFLTATEKGCAWVSRYEDLIKELKLRQ
ncbi:hypothetical protein [Candidatus Nitronereus thalassa]|uniref:Uncharacterized protein n=1 Tax=Candidatus Nitronereus thalassa TaxID=3020898 RepID=A0ABU3K8P3_9BACT|nr:hypothetical protein [Candidatus Nitronereus thalassa]MDT7042770.1 hypothetical protein [Candidatus Nitronereus thalassa]